MTTSLAPAPVASAGSLSPSSSPRLPSPPPFPEIQLSPKSPQSGAKAGSRSHDFDTSLLDNGASRRIRPGTKAADMASGPPLIPLSDLDSPFQLQEHLKALYHDNTKSDKPTTTTPITRVTAFKLARPPENVDRPLWLYELCRFLVQRTNNLIVACFSDSPPCSAHTCPEMRASEWQYLCAVHDPPKSCCAIDYCCHTLDWAANILTSQKHFPSRLTLGSEAAGGSQQGVKQLTNIFRRVYRMFAHAWFQHRQVFWNVEGHEGLYIFFKTVCDVYNLIPEDNYTIPPEAEGLPTGPPSPTSHDQRDPPVPSLLGRSSTIEAVKTDSSTDLQEPVTETTTTISTGATTRRHKHTPSTGSLVTTILEGEEDDHSRIREDMASSRSRSIDTSTSTTSPATPEPMYQSGPVLSLLELTPATASTSVVGMEKETQPHLPLPNFSSDKIETQRLDTDPENEEKHLEDNDDKVNGKKDEERNKEVSGRSSSTVAKDEDLPQQTESQQQTQVQTGEVGQDEENGTAKTTSETESQEMNHEKAGAVNESL